MAYSEAKQEQAQAMFQAAIQMIKENSFTVPADQAPTSDAIAMLIGKAVKWDCIAAQEIAHDILEEVNEHTLAAKFEVLAEEHNATFDMEKA